jgi:hypothetical protein
MKKLLTLALAVVALGSISWAASNLNSSRSNIYRLTCPADVVNQAQANAILADLDKVGSTVGTGQVTEIIKKHGVQADLVKKIIIQPADKTRKQTTIILLTNPADAAQALALSDEGVPNDKPKTKSNK